MFNCADRVGGLTTESSTIALNGWQWKPNCANQAAFIGGVATHRHAGLRLRQGSHSLFSLGGVVLAVELERRLTDGSEFADSRIPALVAENWTSFGVDVLAGRIPAAAVLIEALDRAPEWTDLAFRSTAVRIAVADLLKGDTDDAVLEEVAALVWSSPPTHPEGEVIPLGAPGNGRTLPLLVPDPRRVSCRVVCERFERTIGADLVREGQQPAAIDAPMEPEVAVLRAGVDLLAALVPRLAASVAEHVHLVAVVRPADRALSASNAAVPGAVFLAGGALSDRLSAAEGVLHEATHLRLYELALYRRLYAEHPAKTITPPWYGAESGGGLAWPVDRALAAFHVYVHLAALWFAAAGSTDVLTSGELTQARARFDRCLDKGGYLAHALLGPLWTDLGPDGARFAEGLAAQLEQIGEAS